MNYIHNNPLQPHWRLAELPEEYELSSAKFYERGKRNRVKLHHLEDPDTWADNYFA